MIPLLNALSEMDIYEIAGEVRYFSITWRSKTDGRPVTVLKAHKNMVFKTEKERRGGAKSHKYGRTRPIWDVLAGHQRNVSIDTIIIFNGQKIKA